jgi:hypothetical protein
MGIISRSSQKNNISLSKQEADLLLRTISSCTFEGKDVFLLSSLVNKLSEFVENS